MEDFKKKDVQDSGMDKDIIFSKSIKAGKRIYYLDVKKNRKDELFLAITESKKVLSGEGEQMQVNFEKHKIFLYREDFEKFVAGLHETLAFIHQNQSDLSRNTDAVKTERGSLNSVSADANGTTLFDDKIRIDIDFE